MSKADRLDKLRHKLGFYLSSIWDMVLPSFVFEQKRQKLRQVFASLTPAEQQELLDRVNYYNQVKQPFKVSDAADLIGQFSREGKNSSYFFDFKSLLRFYPLDYRVDYVFGDVVHIPEVPSFVKSRPISEDNQNSVILKLDSVRHYYTVPDNKAFADKKSKLVWRGDAHQSYRLDFVQQFYDHPLCDVGDVGKRSQGKPWFGSYLTVEEQLQCKYVLSMEGYDVATNLKWIMASNSLCFMRKPRFETWFMEGRLIPGVHYVLLKDDHSDFEEKINYYEQHPEEAEQIIGNAQAYMEQFYKKDQELLVSLLVMNRYFHLSGQRADDSL
ncbi:glycosyl transferase family 90 [Marinospirillum sp.]|uniref:glycosyl transferase family 90 n=1 Tax=Marinospirillum sp. TaxID=2183934 RepID=UPI0028704941|nr:glycosyl transferase family 90 [Marinospirillum sp.]MDR9469015.1 glycosyl transferase family 90 [Marinospirillum sp.]